jgi:hypothetical protein
MAGRSGDKRLFGEGQRGVWEVCCLGARRAIAPLLVDGGRGQECYESRHIDCRFDSGHRRDSADRIFRTPKTYGDLDRRSHSETSNHQSRKADHRFQLGDCYRHSGFGIPGTDAQKLLAGNTAKEILLPCAYAVCRRHRITCRLGALSGVGSRRGSLRVRSTCASKHSYRPKHQGSQLARCGIGRNSTSRWPRSIRSRPSRRARVLAGGKSAKTDWVEGKSSWPSSLH